MIENAILAAVHGLGKMVSLEPLGERRDEDPDFESQYAEWDWDLASDVSLILLFLARPV